MINAVTNAASPTSTMISVTGWIPDSFSVSESVSAETSVPVFPGSGLSVIGGSVTVASGADVTSGVTSGTVVISGVGDGYCSDMRCVYITHSCSYLRRRMLRYLCRYSS